MCPSQGPPGRSPPRIVIVGGGYSGAATAIQLVRACATPLAIAIVEPRAFVGAGLAYSADDPDHRLNGNIGTHLVDPADPGELARWYEANATLRRDPDALAPNGQLYIRRSDFAAFVAATVQAHSRAANGSRIEHVRDRATALHERPGAFEVITERGTRLAADLVVLATGNGRSRLPWPFADLAAHPALVADPMDLDRIRGLDRAARVLVLGSGLTALDILSTLVRRGHEGRITSLSRHGLRPRPQRPPARESGMAGILARNAGPVPGFLSHAAPTAHSLLHALRERIAQDAAAGGDWYRAFDELRDVLWKVWPRLPVEEKARVVRRLRPWYDAHRFRAPPQNDALVRHAEAAGTVAFRRGRLRAVATAGTGLQVEWAEAEDGARVNEAFDAVVNCTGLDPSCGVADDPFLAALAAQGLARADPTGLGFEVDAQCRPIGAAGRVQARLRVIGPPTTGTFGDPLGTLFIAPQIARAIPGILAQLGCVAAAPARADRAVAGARDR